MKKILLVTTLVLLSLIRFSEPIYATSLIGTFDGNLDDLTIDDYLLIEGTEYLVQDKSGGGGYTGESWTGTYLGTIIDEGFGSGGLNANDSEPDLENLIGYYINDPSFDITNYLKVENPATNTGTSVTDDDGITLTVTLTSTGSPNLGTWAISPTGFGLEFYVVKGTNEFALYSISPPENDGLWTTQHVTNPSGTAGISHLSGSVTSAPVPEPATMLLFGTGLVGLAGVARRRNKK